MDSETETFKLPIDKALITLTKSWRKYSCPKCNNILVVTPYWDGTLEATCNVCKMSWRVHIIDELQV